MPEKFTADKALVAEVIGHVDRVFDVLSDRINAVDKRDADQWEIGRREFAKLNVMERDVELVKGKVNNLEEKLGLISGSLAKSLDSLHDKLDTVQDTMNNVQANGRKGMSEAFHDIYHEVKDIKEDQSHNLSHSWVYKFMMSGSKLSWIIWGFIVWFTLAVGFHLAGVQVDWLKFLPFITH